MQSPEYFHSMNHQITKQQSYSALVIVSDEDFDTQYYCNINNLNDNAPVFTTEITEVSIEENDGKKSQVTLLNML